uniref:Centrosomal protein 170Aa n=1 Tax=Myripristis murdjan TaxID=586833 RepID=A0A667YJW8_9TELE
VGGATNADQTRSPNAYIKQLGSLSLHRGTPLYGQPSWWGDGDADDENSFKQETKSSCKKHDSSASGEKGKEEGLHASTGHDPSYFEIPTKDGHMATNGIHEIPTKDTEAQGHASFTIEFDNASPGKVTIKDHVSKFSTDHHRSRSKKSGTGSGGGGGRDLSTLQAAMMASESKVADWLAQNDPTLVRSESTEDDSKSIKSDVPVHLKRLKGSKHEDGTQSDSENGLGLRFASRRHALEERLRAAHTSGTRTTGTRTAFMIEFYDEENPRKRRSYSFSQTAPLLAGGAGGEGLSTVAAGAPTAARVLLKQRSEDPSIGRSSASTGLQTGSPAEDDHSDKGTYTIELENRNPEEEEARRMIDKVGEFRDSSHSGILLKISVCFVQLCATANRLPAPFLLFSSSLIPPPLPSPQALPGDSSWVSQWATLTANHTRTDPEGSGAETPAFLHKERGISAERRKRSEERKGGGSGEGGEKSGKPLVRQGSFTIEKPSANVPAELIPRINRSSNGRERSDSVGSMDTATLLKDTEAVMAFLEAKLRDENKLDQRSSKTNASNHGPGSGYPPRTGSISPESDVDTASTASQVAGEAERKAAAGGVQKRRSLSSMHREKSNMSTASKTSVTNTSARERLERKTKSRTAEATNRTDARRSVQPSSSSSRARQPSLDLTDDDQTSSFPISDILSSDQETYSGPGPGLGHSAHGRGSHASTDDIHHSKLDRSGKTSTSGSSKTSRTLQAATASSLGKQASLPQPRPTRASLLRRARLGDTSDTDLADADRVSVASEVSTTSSTSKPPSGRKGPSRLDMLAQPRRNRLGSISARSDSECTVTRSSTSSPRLSAETALRLGLRSATPAENRLTPRMRANSVSKLTEAKTKTTTSGYCSPTGDSYHKARVFIIYICSGSF